MPKYVARLIATRPAERKLGTMKGTVCYMAPDFDAPLEECDACPFALDMQLRATPRDIEPGRHISSDTPLELVLGNAPQFGENHLPILASIDL
jgi:hypothetical protein